MKYYFIFERGVYLKKKLSKKTEITWTLWENGVVYDINRYNTYCLENMLMNTMIVDVYALFFVLCDVYYLIIIKKLKKK